LGLKLDAPGGGFKGLDLLLLSMSLLPSSTKAEILEENPGDRTSTRNDGGK